MVFSFTDLFPADIYLFKVNNENTITMREICLKLVIKTPERRQWRRYGVCIANFEQISYIVLLFPLLTLNGDWVIVIYVGWETCKVKIERSKLRKLPEVMNIVQIFF